jgi:hypothetical protein
MRKAWTWLSNQIYCRQIKMLNFIQYLNWID